MSPLPKRANLTAPPSRISAAELAQIAGRAGRHQSDGSFGVTADVPQFDEALIEQIETHDFEPIKAIYWRNPNLDFSSLRRCF